MIVAQMTPPGERGFAVTYRVGDPRHCPGCGKRHWLIGRLMAQCAYCETALPIEQGAPRQGIGLIRRIDGSAQMRRHRRS